MARCEVLHMSYLFRRGATRPRAVKQHSDAAPRKQSGVEGFFVVCCEVLDASGKQACRGTEAEFSQQ